MASTVALGHDDVCTLATGRSWFYDAPMTEATVALIALSLMFLVVKVARTRKKARRARAATIDLTVDDVAVERRLADGREERAVWKQVVSVEIVCTPVKTADGATAFALIAEGAEAGCLVPLGVGYDDDLVMQLTRLPGLRIEHFIEAREHKPPRRTVIWER